MWALLLSPLGKKIMFWGGIAIAAFFIFRWYTNRVYNTGVAAGRVVATKEIVEAKEKEWAAKDEEYKKLINEVTAANDNLLAQRKELQKDRNVIVSTLDKKLTAIRTEAEIGNEIISKIPGDRLDDALRDVSNQLAKSDTTANKSPY